MSTAVVLFSRDLRVHDNPALAAAAARFDKIVPLFVLDDRLLGSANRSAFLIEALGDLRAALGGRLVVRRGDVVAETLAIRPDAVFVAADSSAYARNRERGLAEQVELTVVPGPAIVPPGELHPAGSDHYRVFTPYWRAWVDTPLRALAGDPPTIRLPAGIDPAGSRRSPSSAIVPPRPGFRVAGSPKDAVCLPGFSRPALPLTATHATGSRRARPLGSRRTSTSAASRRSSSRISCEGGWARSRSCGSCAGGTSTCSSWPRGPTSPQADYRPRGDEWREDEEAFAAWQDGLTGYPIVDAAMRQLRLEGWMPGRARLLAASFLVKDLRIDWRRGAAHFSDLLVDGDLASNSGNWQWVAGTGTDTRPNRVFNPVRQAMRFDPDGAYVRRYVPELASLPAKTIHEPWKLGVTALARLGYPAPLVDHAEASAAFAASRARGRLRHDQPDR